MVCTLISLRGADGRISRKNGCLEGSEGTLYIKGGLNHEY